MIASEAITNEVYQLVKRLGPVDIRKILVIGREKGYLTAVDDDEVVYAIYSMVDSCTLKFTPDHKLTAADIEKIEM